METVDQIRTVFKNAETFRVFLSKQNIKLEEKYGFTPENTHFSEGGCSDEINEPELLLMEQYWGERFKFGGLAGYCHGGRSGLTAFSHHVPESHGKKNLIILSGPHIGFHEGTWGKVIRVGHDKLTSSCGSIDAIINEGYENIVNKEKEMLDLQQHLVEQLLIPYLEDCDKPNILDATRFLMAKIDTDLLNIVKDLKKQFKGKIILITGIIINTEKENYFNRSTVEIFE
ncbi:MAG: hypothetical protein GY714_02765 [Desulfobacterales bacterium]|nr:hypothetical protein [Desulfobacterales bacterium]